MIRRIICVLAALAVFAFGVTTGVHGQGVPVISGPAGNYTATLSSPGPLPQWTGVVSGPAGTYTVVVPDGMTPTITRTATSFIISWGPGPVPPVPPIPPVPPPPPPPGPAPIPSPGLRVLMIYESASLSTMPDAQRAILYDQGIRAYLDSTTPKGSDGKTPEYRIWDKDVNASGDDKLWQTAFARPRTSIPWLIVSNGTSGYEGPLPATVADTMSLIKKYASSSMSRKKPAA